MTRRTVTVLAVAGLATAALAAVWTALINAIERQEREDDQW